VGGRVDTGGAVRVKLKEAANAKIQDDLEWEGVEL
jgi:hypothetical protein